LTLNGHRRKAQGEIMDFRSATTPQSLLGVRLINQPRMNGSTGSSPEHADDLVMPGGR
jgi:hypothetical protein